MKPNIRIEKYEIDELVILKERNMLDNFRCLVMLCLTI